MPLNCSFLEIYAYSLGGAQTIEIRVKLLFFLSWTISDNVLTIFFEIFENSDFCPPFMAISHPSGIVRYK